MRRLQADAHRLEMGVMEFKLTEVDRRIAERLQRLSAVKALVNDRLNPPIPLSVAPTFRSM